MFTLMIAPETFYLNNISVFFIKGSSIIFLLLGQIIFRFKHLINHICLGQIIL